jgi:RNA polymerase sigma-54 factor
MQLNISQQMKMSQQMKLAPRMIQSMEILQLNLMALNERIEQELVDNVTLELIEKEDSDARPRDNDLDNDANERTTGDNNEQPVDVHEKELVVDEGSNNEADFERLVEMSSEWPAENVLGSSRVSANRIADEGDRKHDAMANMTARPQSLHDYLLEQFAFHTCSPPIRAFAEYLIQNLDHNGRLQTSLAQVVQVYGRPISMDEAQLALSLIQQLDPPGVGARDHREMLLLQVKPGMPFHDVLVTLISAHLEDVAHNRLPVIQRKTGYSLDLIKATIEQMQNLDPYPGRGFEVRPVQRVTPDLALELDDDGKYVVKLLDEYIPELRISAKYHRMLQDDPSPETRDWIRKKVESAKWLIESIEQRYSTLKRVAQAIVDHQTDFIEKGPEYIVPLKMQQIADVVKVHVTTVSRAVDEKWIATPRGIFPLKRFFGGGTQTAGGEEVAWDIIRIKLQEIIDNEDKSKPLSDDALVEELAKHGYKLARRTITKYRKNMNIPSSRQRREY